MPAPAFVLLAAALLPFAAHAAPPYLARLVGPFHETESVDVKVSGSVVVGVASINAVGGKAVQSLQLLNKPTPPNRLVCLTLQSRDGVYYSRNTFELPAESEDKAVALPYDRSSRLGTLAKYGREDLAIRASAGPCERSANEYYVLDASAERPAELIRVFVNSFGATDVFHASGSAGKPVACKPIGAGRRTSFDYWCDIPWPPGGEPFDVRILRERFGRDMPAVSLKLFPGSGN
jgi:hypothetical protein